MMPESSIPAMAALDQPLLQAALEACREPLLILDQRGVVLWANGALQSQAASVRGQPLHAVLASAALTAAYGDAQASQALLEQLARVPFGEVSWSAALAAADGAASDGATLLIRWQQLRAGLHPCWLLSFQDRGRRRSDPLRAQQQLDNQQHFINQLIHEVRTPLAIASASLRRAAARAGAAQALAAQHLDVARQELKRITRLVDHLALLTDLDARSQRWRPAAIPLGRLLESWWFELPEEARQRLRICLDAGADHQFLKLDAEAMAIVLNNLLDNSLRFSAAEAPVVLLAQAGANGVQLFLADWGPGIPDGLRERVFDRFRRLEQHRDPERADGSGLGLAVVRELLDQQQVAISLLPAPDLARTPQAPRTVFRLLFASHGLVPPLDRSGLDPELLAAGPGQLEAEEQLRRWLALECFSSAGDGGSP